MTLHVVPLALPEVLHVTPTVHHDARGRFVEAFNHRDFQAATGVDAVFVQDNQSRSARGVLRGLHLQEPNAQSKLVRVLAGAVFDVAVDVRRTSPRFGAWVGCRLDAESGAQLWIPAGFAHGYLVLSDVAEVLYKTTAYYAPECERVLRWDDPTVGVGWPLTAPPLMSPRDAAGAALDAIAV